MTDFTREFQSLVYTLGWPNYQVAKSLKISLAQAKGYLAGAIVPEDPEDILDRMREAAQKPPQDDAEGLAPQQFHAELENLMTKLRWRNSHACEYLHVCSVAFRLWRQGVLAPPPEQRIKLLAKLGKALAEGKGLLEKATKPKREQPVIPQGWLARGALAAKIGVCPGWAAELARRWSLPAVIVKRIAYYDPEVFLRRYAEHSGQHPPNLIRKIRIAAPGESILDDWAEAVRRARRNTLSRFLGVSAKVAALLLAFSLHASGQERPPFLSHPRPLPRLAASPAQVAQAVRANNATLRQVRARYFQRNPYPTHPRERGRHIDAYAMAARRGPWARRRRKRARIILLH